MRFFSYFSFSFFYLVFPFLIFFFNPLNCFYIFASELDNYNHLFNNFLFYSPCIHLFMILHSFANISSLYSLQSLIFLPSVLLTHFLEFSYSNNHFCYYTCITFKLSSFVAFFNIYSFHS
jgi:hypothetical protein